MRNGNIKEQGALEPLNKANHPLESYNFILLAEAVYDLPCKRVTGITLEKEYEYIQEGGQNQMVYMREKPLSKAYSFQVERYVGVDYFDPLTLGAQLEQPLMLYVNQTSGKEGIQRLIFTFYGCVITGKSYGELNAEQAGLMMETTTISYQQAEVEKM